MEGTVDAKYKLTVDLNTIRHLGINLYSNIPAVISEVVANSWDADATHVSIDLDTEKGQIVVEDNGHGMDKSDANTRFLHVGYARREEGRSTTPTEGRPVMGRKGIGKLSLFSIARLIRVESVKTEGGAEVGRCGFVMDLDEIEKSIEASETYLPTPITDDSIEDRHGTRLTITKLKRNPNISAPYLRQRLARRFAVIGDRHSFKVEINGEPIGPEDRQFAKKTQYLWTFDDESIPKGFSGRHAELDPTISPGREVEGWIGTVDERKSLGDGDNAIVILARGKLVHEDILKNLDQGGIFSKYLVGEVIADFLDRDQEDDIATSDRQSLKEDDERFAALAEFIRNALKAIESRWTRWREEDAEREAKRYPAIDEWFGSLSSGRRTYARQLFKKIGSIRVESEDARKELYRHAILAFERLALADRLEVLRGLGEGDDLAPILEIFADVDALEAAHYHEIAKGRVAVIREFENLAPEVKEKVIQKYLSEHLWLLDGSWERATDAPKVEKSVRAALDAVTDKLSEEEKKARLDIYYKRYAGTHVIVELKKYDVNVNIHDLCKQIAKYVAATEKCLGEKYSEEAPDIEVVCVLGSQPLPKNEAARNRQRLKQEGARAVTYDELIHDNLERFSDYLEKEQEVADLLRLVNRI